MNSCNIWRQIRNSSILNGHPSYIKQSSYSSEMVLKKTISTQSNQRKGKLSVIRRKIDCHQLTVEHIETKEASTVMKKFNLENKNLFGSFTNVLKKAARGKKKSQSYKISSVIYQHPGIPIKNFKFEAQSSSSADKTKSFAEAQSVLETITNFPLMDKVDEKELENVSNKSNQLKYNLEMLCQNDKLPSVTSILEQTMPPSRIAILEKWKTSMISKLGEEGFEKYRKDLLFNGQALHQCLTGYFTKSPNLEERILPQNKGHWASLQPVLKDLNEVRIMEENVSHPFLCYKGVVDCLAEYKKSFVVIDWKTSLKPKLSIQTTYDAPLQIAAYVGALNFDPRFKYIVNQGLIVIAYENGTPATVYYLSETELLQYWQMWLDRLKSYWNKIYLSDAN